MISVFFCCKHRIALDLWIWCNADLISLGFGRTNQVVICYFYILHWDLDQGGKALGCMTDIYRMGGVSTYSKVKHASWLSYLSSAIHSDRHTHGQKTKINVSSDFKWMGWLFDWWCNRGIRMWMVEKRVNLQGGVNFWWT